MKKGIILTLAILTLFICHNAIAGKLSSYPSASTLQNGDIFPIVVVASDTNQNINWATLRELVSKNINWQDINGQIVRYNINWTDLSQGASSTNIVCWKSDNKLGKCTTSISGVNCNTCS